jgi:EipB-like
MRDVKNCLLALIVLVAFATQSTSAELAAHRALYELSPSRVDHVATVVPMDGRLAYELTGSACDGYTVNYRIANRFQDPVGCSRAASGQQRRRASPAFECNTVQSR